MFLVINRLNLINIIFLIILGVFRIKVCFLESSRLLRFKLIYFILKKFNFIWLNNDFHGEKLSPKIVIKTSKVKFKIAKKIADKFWMEETRFFLKEKNYFILNIDERIEEKVKFYQKLFYSAKKLRKSGNEKIFFFISKNEINEEMIKEYDNYFILSLSFRSYLKTKNYKKNLKQKKFFLLSTLKKIFGRIKSSKIFDGVNTFFFPHKGVIEHNDIKDYFFTIKQRNRNSIKSKNIKIVEFKKRDLSQENLKFYDFKKIKPIYWNDVKAFSQSNLLLSIIYLFLVYLLLIKAFYKINSRIKFLIIRSILSLEINKIKLKQFKNLKKTLIGYEYLFPMNLAIACKLRKISLISCQRRYVLVFFKQYLLDKYFVMGPLISNYLKKNNFIKIGKIINLGGIINRYKKTKLRYPKINRKKFKYTCLVLDTKSETNWYANKITHNHNWKMNSHFLKLIFEIASHHKDIMFVLKSKNYYWTKLKVFKEDLEKLKSLDNVNLFNQNLKWGNHKIVDAFDFVIGKYTSLIDDFLIRNKPIILYENPVNIEKFINYGSNVFAYSIDDVKVKIQNLKKNFYSYNKKLNKLRKKLYYEFDNEKLVI